MRSLFAVLFCSVFWISAMAVESSGILDFSGKPRSLDEYTGKGKWTIVMIWAHDCTVCNQEAHSYVDFHTKHKEKDAWMVGFSADGQANKSKAEDFIKRHNLNFDNLIAEPEMVAEIFYDLTGAIWSGTPTFLVYNPKGELRAQQVGAVPVNLIEAFMEKESIDNGTTEPKK